MRHMALHAAMAGWRGFLWQRERLRISLGHFMQNALYKALQTWSDWTDAKILSHQRNAL